MEQPAESDGQRYPEGDVATPELLTVEEELEIAVKELRNLNTDATLFALWCVRVLKRLREVAPDLVAAAEEEVYRNPRM